MTTATGMAHERERPASIENIVVKCAALTKVFRDFWYRSRVRAVSDLDLEIYRGEVFGLLGPNGSGKSTTIKMILGLLHPTSGRIAVFGKLASDVAIKQRIGYLPEESYLYPFLNARETLDYYGRLFHQPRATRQRRIDMLLEMVGLEAVQRRTLGEYSKGMQRRIGLAQALINDPELLILDEPTTGLDPIGTRQIKDLILQLRDRGKTILLCSHLLSDVEDVCDRVSIMFGGRVRAEGTVDELLVREDLTTIQTPSLDSKTIDEVEQVLERHGKAIEKVERPRKRLESLFLDIVHAAQREGLETSGAGSAGRIAEFLVGGDVPRTEGEQLIDQLVAGSEPPQQDETTPSTPTGASGRAPSSVPAAEAPAAEAPAVEVPPVEEDERLIARLTGGGDGGMQPQPPAPLSSEHQPAETPPPRRDENVDEEAIADLITDGWQWAEARQHREDAPLGGEVKQTPDGGLPVRDDRAGKAEAADETARSSTEEMEEPFDQSSNEPADETAFESTVNNLSTISEIPPPARELQESDSRQQEPHSQAEENFESGEASVADAAETSNQTDTRDETTIAQAPPPPSQPGIDQSPVAGDVSTTGMESVNSQQPEVDTESQRLEKVAGEVKREDSTGEDDPPARPAAEDGSMFTEMVEHVAAEDHDGADDEDWTDDPVEPEKAKQAEQDFSEAPDQTFIDALTDMKDVKRIDDEFDEHDPLADHGR